MKIAAQQDIPEARVELVPLIDCVFLLLIFFMCAATMSHLDTSAQVSLPVASNAAEQKDPGRRGTVNILPTGAFTATGLRITDAQPFFVYGQCVDDEGLKRLITQALKTEPSLRLYLRCDRNAKFAKVRRAMAACAEAGVADVIFGAYPEDQTRKE